LAISSPFTPGDLPRVLIGRARERTRLGDLLARVVTFGELAGPPVVLHAPRGLGKTSLLRDTEDRARELGFVTAWVACAKGSPMLAELATSVRQALVDADILDERTRRGVLATVGLEVGVPGITLKGELAPGDAPAPPPAAAIAGLERMLHTFAASIRDRGWCRAACAHRRTPRCSVCGVGNPAQRHAEPRGASRRQPTRPDDRRAAVDARDDHAGRHLRRAQRVHRAGAL
jgi:hypothetical protein